MENKRPPTCFVALNSIMQITVKITGDPDNIPSEKLAKYVSKGNKKYIKGIVIITQNLVLPILLRYCLNKATVAIHTKTNDNKDNVSSVTPKEKLNSETKELTKVL